MCTTTRSKARHRGSLALLPGGSVCWAGPRRMPVARFGRESPERGRAAGRPTVPVTRRRPPPSGASPQAPEGARPRADRSGDRSVLPHRGAATRSPKGLAAWAAERHRPLVVGHLQWPQDADSEHLSSPAQTGPPRWVFQALAAVLPPSFHRFQPPGYRLQRRFRPIRSHRVIGNQGGSRDRAQPSPTQAGDGARAGARRDRPSRGLGTARPQSSASQDHTVVPAGG
jgi:hypothetical protein